MSEAPRVLHVIRVSTIGGIQSQARDISSELCRRGLSTELLLLDSTGLDDATRAWHEAKVPLCVCHDQAGHYAGVDRLVKLRRTFAARPEAVLHFHYALPDSIIWNEVLAARLAGKRVVATLHHALRWSPTSARHRLRQKIARGCVDQVVVTTAASKKLTAQRFSDKLVNVIPCGIDPAPVQLCRESARASLGIDPSEFLIVFVGRLVDYKGAVPLARAFAAARDRGLSARLLIAGSGPDSESLAAMAESVPGITLSPFVEDVQPLYAAADLMAMPSSEEGFGLVYAEAARYAVPSVACNLPTVTEVVVDGETGWLVPPGDQGCLEAALHEAMANPAEAQRRGEAAREHVRRFSLTQVVDQLEALYAKVLQG